MVDWHVLFTASVFFFEFLNMWNLYNLFVFVDLGWPFPLNQLLGESTLSPWYGIENSWSICEQSLYFFLCEIAFSFSDLLH